MFNASPSFRYVELAPSEPETRRKRGSAAARARKVFYHMLPNLLCVCVECRPGRVHAVWIGLTGT